MRGDGYITEIPYAPGYYRELSPRLIGFSLLLNGFEPPPVEGAAYLELGFGQGLSANIHAAGSAIRLYGTDLLPAHVDNAKSLATASGANARFFDDSFEEFAKRDGLPQFDYIIVHGVWSWIGDEARRQIIGILRDRLKPEGVVFISYNALPGREAERALRALLLLKSSSGDGARPLGERIDQGLSLARRAEEAGARFFLAYPTARRRLARLATQSHNYLAHEFFNRDWQPSYFADVNADMSRAGLSFAGPQSPLDAIPALNFSPEQMRLMQEIANPIDRQSLRDFLLNTEFRRDLFVRNARKLTQEETERRISQILLANAGADCNEDLALTGARGRMKVAKEHLRPILDHLAQDRGIPKTIASTLASAGGTLSPAKTMEALVLLIGSAKLSLAQSDDAIAAARPFCSALNERLMTRALEPGAPQALASPVTGIGHPVAGIEQHFLKLYREGVVPSSWAHATWEQLKQRDRHLAKEGRRLESEEKNLDVLERHARTFAEKSLGTLKALGIAA